LWFTWTTCVCTVDGSEIVLEGKIMDILFVMHELLYFCPCKVIRLCACVFCACVLRCMRACVLTGMAQFAWIARHALISNSSPEFSSSFANIDLQESLSRALQYDWCPTTRQPTRWPIGQGCLRTRKGMHTNPFSYSYEKLRRVLPCKPNLQRASYVRKIG